MDVVRQHREYRDFAMGRDGNAQRGRELFNDEKRAACSKCHSVDGSASKAGPDLYAVGDKFPRRELIRAIQEPSADIAVGYGTTIIQTKAGEELQGILKESTAEALELVGGDGKHVRIAARDIKEQRGSTVSLMPEGLEAGLTREEFSDLIEYLVTLKQPENASAAITPRTASSDCGNGTARCKSSGRLARRRRALLPSQTMSAAKSTSSATRVWSINST